MQRNTGYFPTESLEPSGNRLFSRSALNEGYLFRGSLSMACVGVIEEVIFRGFLFKAMCKDNIKLAVFISSITFGMGHIVNLLNGKDLIATLLQICYASAIGFLFTIIFYKGKSLLPCIITHGCLLYTSPSPRDS